jgi:hypothetical protein
MQATQTKPNGVKTMTKQLETYREKRHEVEIANNAKAEELFKSTHCPKCGAKKDAELTIFGPICDQPCKKCWD